MRLRYLTLGCALLVVASCGHPTASTNVVTSQSSVQFWGLRLSETLDEVRRKLGAPIVVSHPKTGSTNYDYHVAGCVLNVFASDGVHVSYIQIFGLGVHKIGARFRLGPDPLGMRLGDRVSKVVSLMNYVERWRYPTRGTFAAVQLTRAGILYYYQFGQGELAWESVTQAWRIQDFWERRR